MAASSGLSTIGEVTAQRIVETRVREAAARELAARGDVPLAELRMAAAKHANPEVRRRVQNMVAGLERTLALAPRRITLAMQNRPLSQIIAEVAKGYKLDDKILRPSMVRVAKG